MVTFLIVVACALPLSLIGVGARLGAAHPREAGDRLQGWLVGHLLAFAAVYLLALGWAASTARAANSPAEGTPTAAAEPGTRPAAGGLTVGDGLAILGIALATAISVLGASYAVAVVGSAALGAITEKPELFGRTLIFIGLAEGLAIYGLIVSILLLGRLR